MMRLDSVRKIGVGSYPELHTDTPLCGCGLSLQTDIANLQSRQNITEYNETS